MTDPLTPTCFNPAEESAYYFERLAELEEQAQLQDLQELEETPISTNRAIETRNSEELPLPLWLLDEGHDLEESSLEPLEALEVAA